MTSIFTSNTLSVIAPVYNEALSLHIFLSKLTMVMEKYEYVYEIIAVNDGSKDDSLAILKEWAIKDSRIKVMSLRYNSGQTAALQAGIQHASGDVIVLIDSDLENNPEDIPKLLDKLSEGYDVVSGWRLNRWKNQLFTRKLPSLLANKIISAVSGVCLHDYGCTLKAYRSDIIKDVALYGEMHRFIPVYCSMLGGSITEIPVDYKPRKFGKSNYGIMRIYKVLLDILLLRFIGNYMNKPIHFFGGAGIFVLFLAILCSIWACYYKIAGLKDFTETPLPILIAMFTIVGVQMIFMGVITEVLMRTYYESQGKTTYSIKEKINFDI